MDLDKASQQLAVASHRIPYLLVGDERQPWFQGKPLAEALEYSNTRHAVANNVEDHHRKTLEELKTTFGATKVISGGGQPDCPPTSYSRGQSLSARMRLMYDLDL